MKAMELVGLNTKYYRYLKGWTQEMFAEKTGLKMAYLSTIETGIANLTCKNIDLLANTFKIKVDQLFNEETAKKALELPSRVDKFQK